jgi:hypothetical protein
MSFFCGLGALVVLYAAPQVAAQTSTDTQTASASVAPKSGSGKDEQGASKVGVGFRVSSLGFGGEVAVAVTHSSNVRGGFNFIGYSRGFNYDGAHYAANLRWLSAEAHYDWFPLAHFARAFHLSPGLMLYNDNHVNATASIPGGSNFTLNGVSYSSSATNPVTGTGSLSFNKVAPTFMAGFGNLVPRKKGKHFSFIIEGGFAYQGAPKIGLNLAGTACIDGVCSNIGTNSTIQGNIQGEQTVISNDLSPFKFYPLVAFTFGYRL